MVLTPTDFCADMSNGSKDIAICVKFQNGGHVVQPIWQNVYPQIPKESIETKIIIFLIIVQKLLAKNGTFSNLMIHRWRCSQLWHGPSDHGVDEVYQVLF